MENPILHDTLVRQHHIVLCVLVGAAYAVSFGLSFKITPQDFVVDSLASILLFFGEAVMLWTIFTYSRLEFIDFYQSVAIHIVYAIVAVALMLALEYLIVDIIVPGYSDSFIKSFAARAFCLIIIYTSYRKYYTSSISDDVNYGHSDITDNKADTESVVKADVIERITVKVGTKIKVIPVDEIICLKAEDDYVSIVTAEGHWLKSERLKDYEMSLPSDNFARVHRSYIVNISKISKIERYGQKQMLSMSDGEQIRISMTGYKVLKDKLNL
ncbi:MAG: LytTR family transcriptional regulator [Prevotella sp.]|nr:LytTR family transcriptional regulator [Prevotella sp.]